MNDKRTAFPWVVVALLACGLAVLASRAGEGSRGPSYKEQVTLNSQTFLDAHPDMKYRKTGWEAYEQQDYLTARGEFTKAARYGDKVSQAMLAEMSWKGQGEPADRELAYVWADLAAERGYSKFLALREFYWRELNESGRANALVRGRPMLLEYADAVTADRLSRHLRKHLQRIKFSSMTAAPPREVRILDYYGHSVRIDGNRFFSPKFWDPVKYQAWQDAQWKDMPEGKVDVGDVEPLRSVQP